MIEFLERHGFQPVGDCDKWVLWEEGYPDPDGEPLLSVSWHAMEFTDDIIQWVPEQLRELQRRQRSYPYPQWLVRMWPYPDPAGTLPSSPTMMEP